MLYYEAMVIIPPPHLINTHPNSGLLHGDHTRLQERCINEHDCEHMTLSYAMQDVRGNP